MSYLKKSDFFDCIDEKDLNQIEEIFEEINFPKYTTILVEGEMSNGLYVLLEGSVTVFKNHSSNGKFFDIAELRDGEIFGEVSLIDDQPRAASVRSNTDVKVLFLDKKKFQTWLQNKNILEAIFYKNAAKLLSRRLRDMDENMSEMRNQLWRAAIQKKNQKEAA